jgi:hypothetical protein
MSQSSARTAPRRRSVSFTASTTVPMATLFPQPTQVDVVVIGGGGGGANIVPDPANGNTVYGAGGGAGGSVVEYKDIWVTNDLVVTVGAGGAANIPGGRSSVVCSVPGPFSGIYTAPGGENGGRGPDGMSQSSLYRWNMGTDPYGNPIALGVDNASLLDPNIAVVPSPYNAMQDSPATLLDGVSRLQIANDRQQLAFNLMSQPLFFSTTDGTNPVTGSATTNPSPTEVYNVRMSRNPGRGVSGGSTGGAGGGLIRLSTTTTTGAEPYPVPSVAAGYPGNQFGDGFYTTTAPYAYGGGGGGGSVGSPAAGGIAYSGGGKGASSSAAASAGAVNTGGGGGGGSQYFPSAASGGSGLVILTWTE